MGGEEAGEVAKKEGTCSVRASLKKADCSQLSAHKTFLWLAGEKDIKDNLVLCTYAQTENVPRGLGRWLNR